MFQIISTVVKEAKGKDFYLGQKPKDRKASVVVAVVTKVRQFPVDDFQGKSKMILYLALNCRDSGLLSSTANKSPYL